MTSSLAGRVPARGPVHPSYVPIFDPSGIGWLEGFDELLVRCGLESNGAPEFDSKGSLKYPLHGRIANLPAHQLSLSVDPVAGTLDVVGTIDETRFLVRGVSLKVHYQFKINQPTISIVDTATNHSSKPTSIQLLYHINIGQPILEAGSQVFAPISKLSPRDPHAATDIDHWSVYLPPTPGYAEQVYFAEPMGDSQNWTTSLLCDSRAEQAFAVRFDTKTLPFLSVWKNTAAVEDGYVTGIEPATGFPNTRGFEESRGRLVQLAAGESRRFRVQLEPILERDRVESTLREIQALQSRPIEVREQPDPIWSSAGPQLNYNYADQREEPVDLSQPAASEQEAEPSTWPRASGGNDLQARPNANQPVHPIYSP